MGAIMKLIKKIYNWTLSWADTKYGIWALAGLSFTESSFFPVPPDVLLIALCAGKPKKSFYFAFICSVASVLGGILGYFIGSQLWNLAEPILHFYGWFDKIEQLGDIYRQHAAWAIAAAGFTPIPYKIFTITGGYFKINFGIFVLASTLARSARFFLVSGLIFFFGDKIKKIIDKYFNVITILFFILLIGGFIILKKFF